MREGRVYVCMYIHHGDEPETCFHLTCAAHSEKKGETTHLLHVDVALGLHPVADLRDRQPLALARRQVLLDLLGGGCLYGHKRGGEDSVHHHPSSIIIHHPPISYFPPFPPPAVEQRQQPDNTHARTHRRRQLLARLAVAARPVQVAHVQPPCLSLLMVSFFLGGGNQSMDGSARPTHTHRSPLN